MNHRKGRVCVVGAGIFGATAAIVLARNGWAVTLCDRATSLFSGASGSNIFRLHRGYHYPRSIETARESLAAHTSFQAEYSDAILNNVPHYYGIANYRSLTSATEFIHHCRRLALPLSQVTVPEISTRYLEALFQVDEARIDPYALQNNILSKILKSEIALHLGERVSYNSLAYDNFDFYILAANYGNHKILEGLQSSLPLKQYEICEVAVLDMLYYPLEMDLVILDGDFISLSPLGNTGRALLYHVRYSVHYREEAISFKSPPRYQDLLGRGMVKVSHVSNWKQMVDDAQRFVPAIRCGRYVGSFFSVRTVLPSVESTDSRPTLIRKHSNNVIEVFSGKIVTAVDTANAVVSLLNKNL